MTFDVLPAPVIADGISYQQAVALGRDYLLPYSATADLDARWLLDCVLAWETHGLTAPDPMRIPAVLDDLPVFSPDTPVGCGAVYADVLGRCAGGEPVAHIVGYRGFWDTLFYVNGHVLDPRPDTEIMIAQCVQRLPADFGGRFLDLGTGSGCIMATLLRIFPRATGVAVDICPRALAVAQTNFNRLGVADRVQTVQTSWTDGLAGGAFDCVVCNPPYIDESETLAPHVTAYDPHGALFADNDGLADYQILLKTLPRVLAPNAVVLFEIGQGQERAVAQFAQTMGWNMPEMVADYGDIVRCLVFNT